MYKGLFIALKRCLSVAVICLLTVSFAWQGSFVATAMADVGDRIESKVDRDIDSTKDFIDNTKQSVKNTANRNAGKIDRATDESSIVDNKAEKDADRIENKANKDAARTKDALDKTDNVIESAIDSIKDVFDN